MIKPVLTIFTSLTIGFISLAPRANAKDLTAEFDARHKACLEQIAQDADLAFENAMIWRDNGGGRRAKHCEAMALFAVGHKEEAAFRLDKLAKASDGGTPAMRADFYSEAANFWLIANLPNEAYRSASDGLALKKDHTPLRIARASAYVLLDRHKDAETDLTSALVFDPGNARIYRYRADARLKQNKLEDAQTDIEKSLDLDPTSVETAVVRGHINEAIRLAALSPEPTPDVETLPDYSSPGELSAESE